MAYYSRQRVLSELSASSDYAKPKYMVHSQEDTTPTQFRYHDLFEVNTTATTYSLAQLATCKWLCIHNPSTNSYKVTATIKTTANSGTSFLVDIDPGETILIPDLYATGGAVADVSLTSTTSAQKVDISFEGT